MMKTALTIAGSDCSGGAGIQADIKTMLANGVYGMSVITALTAQNTQGVEGVLETPPEFLEKQLECVFADIFPDAVKVGMVSSERLIRVIADVLGRRQAQKIVLDPVMVSTSGARLMEESAVHCLTEQLFPLAEVVTPNIPEAEVLAGMRISSKEEMAAAAMALGERHGCAVLVKGGHLTGAADDFLWTREGGQWFAGERVVNPNTHGTGCTLSSAIASHLARGRKLPEAVGLAKEYLSGALRDGMDLGKGKGPLNHGYIVNDNNFCALGV